MWKLSNFQCGLERNSAWKILLILFPVVQWMICVKRKKKKRMEFKASHFGKEGGEHLVVGDGSFDKIPCGRWRGWPSNMVRSIETNFFGWFWLEDSSYSIPCSRMDDMCKRKKRKGWSLKYHIVVKKEMIILWLKMAPLIRYLVEGGGQDLGIWFGGSWIS